MSPAPESDRARTARGAICGAAAAALWAVLQPLDKRVFKTEYDDVELLGKALTRGDGWYAAGLAMHLSNGAAFGGLYASLAPTLPLPPVLRGPVVAVGEHVFLWPLVAVTDRLHPARDQLPRLGGNRRAFYAGLWRHALFGFVLGELERHLNADPPASPPASEVNYSSNGHGSLEHAISAGTASASDVAE